MCQMMKNKKNMHVISVINTIDEDALVARIKERLRVVSLTSTIINFDSDCTEGYD